MAESARGKSALSHGQGLRESDGSTVRPVRRTSASPLISHTSRTIRTDHAPFRWECPCQSPAVLLATYDPGGKINIKVRDRYWHLYGFGSVQAICPRCAAEHLLDLRLVGSVIDHGDSGSAQD
ncbi:MAG: hypothetical protein WKF81_12460 [Thermomicrobiales bacterium]